MQIFQLSFDVFAFLSTSPPACLQSHIICLHTVHAKFSTPKPILPDLITHTYNANASMRPRRHYIYYAAILGLFAHSILISDTIVLLTLLILSSIHLLTCSMVGHTAQIQPMYLNIYVCRFLVCSILDAQIMLKRCSPVL